MKTFVTFLLRCNAGQRKSVQVGPRGGCLATLLW